MTQFEQDPSSINPAIERSVSIRHADRDYRYDLPATTLEDGSLAYSALDLVDAINRTPGLMSQKLVVLAGCQQPASGSVEVVTPKLEIVSFADNRIRIEEEKRMLFVDDEPSKLTHLEYQYLSFLGRNTDIVLSEYRIAQAVYRSRPPGSNGVMVFISNLREKFGAELGDKKQGAIRTRRGLGYVAVSKLALP